MTELKPCLCGSKDIRTWITFGGQFVAICNDCERKTYPRATEEEVIDAWNRMVQE